VLKRTRSPLSDAAFLANTKKAIPIATQLPGRFGDLRVDDGAVAAFQEEPQGDNSWINGGFFVLSPKVLDYIDGEDTLWEMEPIERLASENQLSAFLHASCWQPMDTLCDKTQLEALWATGKAPWQTWK
jgi:glucose-1-phosphate cytidylyltransferase